LLIIINRLSGLVLPGSGKYLIDNVITNGQRNILFPLLGLVALAVGVQSISSFLLTRILSVEAQNLIANLRSKMLKQIIHLPVNYFDNQKTGSLVSRIMTDVEGVRNLVGTGFVQLIGGILSALISLIILIRINWLLTLCSLLPLILFGIISMKAFGFIRPIFRKRGEINADVTGRLTESLNGIRIIKGFNAEDQEKAVFSIGVNRLFKNVKKSLTSTSLITSSATFLLGLTTVVIMGLGADLILKGAMTVGDFFAFILYLGFMIAPIVQMSNIGSQITEALAGLDRMEEILRLKREIDDEQRTIELRELKGKIEFNKVSFAYEKGKEVLKDINFKAEAGTVTALVGSSGSGKTTIAGLTASFLNPSKGSVQVDGEHLSKITLNSYRSHLGVVLQDDFLFEGTIRENILFARPNSTDEDLLEAVKAAYVHEFTDRFDDGLNTLIGERGVKLSGGQRQRIAIARALLADPKILILDEATSNLDTESESFIQKSLNQLMKGRTTFVIAHRLSTIRQAHQILVIEEGNIVEKGTHDELIHRKGRYFDLYTHQSRI
ncbi:ABC transporter ATP-binding protein, partial [Xanthovirga aplysinae]|uniref:ABC transporter ATP-binding protein n=1 Tax=Xanthovirga aplysinae TaxID=2529853 RepID=UPI0012BC58A5